MSEIPRESLRNVAMISSAGVGKTSLAEAILFASGAVPRLGSIAQGTTVSDFEPEELHRRSSVSTSLLRCSWNHTTINLVDPPGALNLLGETVMALRAVDAVILVVGASSGIRSDLIRLWSRVKTLGLPCLLFLNELDKDGASLDLVVETCQRDLGIMPVPMSLPWGSGVQLEGVLDLLQQSVITSRTDIPTLQHLPIPENATTVVGDARKRIQEAAAERDDRLLEQYLAAGELTQEDLINGLRLGVQASTIAPALQRLRHQEYRDRSAPQCDCRFSAIAYGAGFESSAGRSASKYRRSGESPCRSRRTLFRDCLQDAGRPVSRTTVLSAGLVGGPSRRLDGLQ